MKVTSDNGRRKNVSEATASVTKKESPGIRARIQRLGSFLSGMIMPNISAFIAWGLITALFIPTGWWPNPQLAELVGPIIKYLLPLLIAYTGGKMVYDVRGGVVGAAATMGVIVGADIPMFLGAMILGPFGGYLIKQVDKAFHNRVRQGFEMLVNNFSAGILAAILMIFAYLIIDPVIVALNKVLMAGVKALIESNLIPLANIFIEPAKVLFLNNAINHGILSPLGVQQAAEHGKSILFLLEPNPGPGLGVLLAYMVFGKGSAKRSAPGAAIIQFLGGIHEIYFPYILMNPLLIFAAIAGGVCGTFIFNIMQVGLISVPSPGSIFAVLAMTPKGNFLGVVLGVLVAAAVSFAVSSVILRFTKTKEDDESLQQAAAMTQSMKGKESAAASYVGTQTASKKSFADVEKIVFACDAGMGSSAMGASIMRDKVKKAGLDIEVTNASINQLAEDADLVITHKDLTDRAKQQLPDTEHISVDNFLGSPKYDEVVAQLIEAQGDSTRAGGSD
ncbi:MAG TPA: PTS mannitol transporter subunit IICB [Bacillales bacterium]|nr:PTS mannitol transporter subunit IICB [Bacillales bacterium]